MDVKTDSLMASGLDLIAQGLTIYDAELRLQHCNQPFQSMFNLPDHLAIPGARFEDTIRFLAERGEYGQIDDVDAFTKERVHIARAFEPHYMERTRANGKTISVEGAPLAQGGWVTVYTDITSEKRQEELLRARASELSELVLSNAESLAATNRKLEATVWALNVARREIAKSEARMRLTTEMMPAHMAHADATWTYTYSNRRLNSVLKNSPSDIVGMSFQEALGPEAYTRVLPSLQKAYDGKPAVCEFTDAADGRRIRASFTPDGAGGVYILSMDITEETQARVALQQTRRREMAAQMTSGLAHDFSNLLTIILGLQSKIARTPGVSQELLDLAKGISAAANRGGDLLNSIANITARRGPRPTATQVPNLLRDIAILAAPTLPASVTLETICTLDDTPFLLDAGQMQDALLNLILNARDACGAQGKITLSAAPLADTWIEFSVADTGAGFSDEALTHALDPFFTTKGAEGTGLGLPSVYDMTKLAGGDIHLENRPDGAVVRLRLPQRRAPSGQGGLVLLVEDSEELRAQYRDMLLDMGHSVVEAVTVDEAVALLADIPDVAYVLSDIRLEGEPTGVDLAHRVGAQFPVILMTSLPPTDPLFIQAEAMGLLLRKPFPASALMAALNPQVQT